MSHQYRPSIESLVRDVRHSLRLLGRSPGFATIAILTLAIGIGASTTTFTLLNRALLQSLPVAEPNRLVALNNVAPNRMFPTFSYPNYVDLRDRATMFDGLIGFRFAPLSVSHDGINERVWGYLVTGNYFDVLGVRAAIGRTIAPSDDQVRGAHPVTVVSHGFWQQRLGGARDVVGRGILVNGRSYTIIGVAPDGFFGTEVVSAPDLWFPVAMQAEIEAGDTWLDNRRVENMFLVGRLNSGVTAPQAQAALTGIAIQLEQEHPDINEGRRVALSPPGLVGNAMRAPVLGFTGLLLLIAGLVLLLACANLANLLLARAADRRREMAVRMAIGAGRLALVRQLLTESLLLAAAAGTIGLLLALWLVRLANAFELPVDIPVTIDLSIDWRVLTFNILLSALTGIVFGLLPALQATKADLATALKDGIAPGHPRESRWKKGLIVVQVAVSLVLLVGGGLMVRALARAQAIPLGFTPEGAAEVSFDLRLQGYAPENGREFQQRLLERARTLPGVRHAALADMIPVDLHFSRVRVFPEGVVAERTARGPVAYFSRVSPGYFQAMNTRLEAGRDFTGFDNEGAARVAIVNRAFARRLWPGEDAVGRRFRLGGADAPLLHVIGIVQDGRYGGLNEDSQPIAYRPLLQSYSGSTTVVVRADADLARVIALVQADVRAMDPHIPIASARTLLDRLALPLFPARLTAWILGSFGALALVLAAVGLYGVMSYMVSTRTHEFGVRMAMGAREVDVLTLVLRQGLGLTAAGLAVGVCAAVLMGALMRGLLFGVSSTDAPTYGAVLAMLAGVALVACLVPARRATRMDPLQALRQ